MSTTLEAPKVESDCRICRARGRETFRYLGSRYVFDIDLARKFVSDGREAVELETDDVHFSLKKCRINKEHVGHVDVKYPGIIAHVWYTNPDGTTVRGHRLIDGHHRASRCLELGIPFMVHVLSEEESRAVVQRSPEKVAEVKDCKPDEARERNRQAWNSMVMRKQRFTLPANDEYLARHKKLSRWLRDDGIAGKRTLLLGAGGGSQSVLYALHGAIVTVVDLSDDMLALDREQAEKRGLDIRVVQASMDDLSVLEPAQFDLVDQPVSTCYVPDVAAVYREVARVIAPGGMYLSQHKQPTSLQCSVTPSSKGFLLTEPYYREGPLPPVAGSRHREEGTLEFLHRWEQLLGGLCRAGFVIEDVTEPFRTKSGAKRGSFEHRCKYIPPYVRIKARRVDSAPSGFATQRA